MSRPQLVQRWRSTTNTQLGVFKWVNGSLIQIGNDFGSDSASTDVGQQLNNRAVQWNGILYSCGFNYFWKYDPATSGVWGPIFDYTDAAVLGNEVGRYGPVMPMDVGGESKLIFSVTDSSDNFVAIHMNIDETFEVQVPLSVTSAGWSASTDSTYLKSQEYKGDWIWFNMDGTWRIYAYNPNGNTITEDTITVGVAASNSPDLCPFQGQLYALAFNGSNLWNLYRKEGSNLVEVLELHSTTKFSNLTELESTLYTDGDFLYALIKLTGAQIGWYLKQIQIDPTGITTFDRTSNLPSHLIVNNGLTGRSASWWGMCYTDLESNPGGAPEINLYYSEDNAEGNTIVMYKHSGPTNAFEFLGAGGDIFQLAMSYSKIGGGHRTWVASGELDGFITSTNVVGSVVDFEYIIGGGSGQPTNVRWYLDNNNEPPRGLATVIAASGGTIIQGGTVISGVIADGTMKSFTWAAVADGIGPTDKPLLIPRFSAS